MGRSFHKIILCSLLICCSFANMITFTNHMARTLRNPKTYLPRGGLKYTPRSIEPGKSGTIMLDNYDLMYANNVTGLLSISYAGSAHRIAIAWRIHQLGNTIGSDNLIGVYWGDQTNNTRLYLDMFNTTSSLSSDMKMGKANEGWRSLEPSNGILINVFMATDTGRIDVIVEEHKRKPHGQYFIQSVDNSLFLRHVDKAIRYDHLSTHTKLARTFKWNIVNEETTFDKVMTIRATDTTKGWKSDGNVTSPVGSTRSLTMESPVTSAEALYLWDVRHISSDIYSFWNYKNSALLDANNCDDVNYWHSHCSAGQRAGLTLSWNRTSNISQTLHFFRLIPVEIEDHDNPPTTISP